MRFTLGWAVLSVAAVAMAQADELPSSTSALASTSAADSSSSLAHRQAAADVPGPTPGRNEHVILDPSFKVTKVHEVNNTETYKTGGNYALEFERDYWNYGAITLADKEARRGQIYVISWANKGPAADLQTRFEYRQVNTKDQVYSKEVDFPHSRGTKRSIFQIVGNDYRQNGPVYSWRFTVLRGDRIVAVDHSFIW